MFGVLLGVTNVTDANFDAEVLKSKIPVVVDVWATWCGPCRAYGPVVEEVAKEYDGKIRFVKLDADENDKTTQKYEIMSIPTTMLVEKGQIKAVNVGAVQKDALKKWIESNL